MPLRANQIAVWAGPEQHAELAKNLQPPAEPEMQLIPLSTLDACRTTETLKRMFGDVKSGGPRLDCDQTRNTLIVRGSAEQIQEVKNALRVLGEGEGKSPTMRIITLEQGSAKSLAEALQTLVPQLRKSPVKVILPGAIDTGPPKKSEPPKPDAKSGKSEAPITITVFGNKLIVTSDDPQALVLIEELSRLIQAPTVQGDFEPIRLKYAQALNVERILNEMFNDQTPRIRVVVDPSSNTLLVRASVLDMHTIRRLLDRTLDVPEASATPREKADKKKSL
jgi:type II secretory pathway component GspD/PulD (secretin)